MTDPGRPEQEIERVRAATARLLATVLRLDAAALAEPSLLPGWSRAHVVAHLARNADSHLRMLDGERQYPGAEERAAEIDRTAGQDRDGLVEDLVGACGRWAERMAAVTDWSRTVNPSGRAERPASGLPRSRFREVEVHHVDLAAGYGPADWPAGFAETLLGDATRSMRERGDGPALRLTAPDGLVWATGEPPAYEVGGPARPLAAWLIGRSEGAGLTVHPPGPLPRPPRWA